MHARPLRGLVLGMIVDLGRTNLSWLLRLRWGAIAGQLVTILVEVPAKVSRQQRKLIEQLAEEMGIDTMPQQASFMDKLRSLFE